jgi:hypothetical protein
MLEEEVKNKDLSINWCDIEEIRSHCLLLQSPKEIWVKDYK